MTRNEVLNKFSYVDLFFVSYFKYCFSFKGETETHEIIAHFGSDQNTVYELELQNKIQLGNSMYGLVFLQVKNKATGFIEYEADYY
jgi:hypothetical protein